MNTTEIMTLQNYVKDVRDMYSFFFLLLTWIMIRSTFKIVQHHIRRYYKLTKSVLKIFIKCTLTLILKYISICHNHSNKTNNEIIQIQNALKRWPYLYTAYFVLRFHEIPRMISIAIFAGIPLRDSETQFYKVSFSQNHLDAIKLRECTFLVRSKGLTRRLNEIYWNSRWVKTEKSSSEEIQKSFK